MRSASTFGCQPQTSHRTSPKHSTLALALYGQVVTVIPFLRAVVLDTLKLSFVFIIQQFLHFCQSRRVKPPGLFP